MPRYITRLYADDCAFDPRPPSSTITVNVSDDLADTGLFWRSHMTCAVTKPRTRYRHT